MSYVEENDLVLLVGQDRKEFIIRVQAGGQLQTHRGCILHDELLGKSQGRQIHSHLGYPFVVLVPGLHDIIRLLKRATQIMYPKDISYVLLRLNVMPDSRVVEAGTGSGGLTMALSRAVGQSGRVYSYEVRPDVLRLARQNLEGLGLAGAVEFKLRDIAEGFDERDVDALFLDVRRPWSYLRQVLEALRDSGFFGALVPTTNQVEALLHGMEEVGAFAPIEVEEVLVRSYKAVPARLRPVDRMIAHTGYLIFARKVDRSVSDEGYWKDRRRRRYEKTRQALADQESKPDGAA
jgi:tRNA (adenine57-N1/adenine58-N1)-methyltransferase